MTVLVLAQHLGELHAYERLLVILLAFGPFVVLAVVVYVVRKRDVAAEESAPDQAPREAPPEQRRD